MNISFEKEIYYIMKIDKVVNFRLANAKVREFS